MAVAALLLGWEWESYEQAVRQPHSPSKQMGRCFCWLKQPLELVVPWIIAVEAGWPVERRCRLTWGFLIKICCLGCEKSLSLVLLHTCLCVCLVFSHTDSFSYKWVASSVPSYPPSPPQAIVPAVTGETRWMTEEATCLGLCEQASTLASWIPAMEEGGLLTWQRQEPWCSSWTGWLQTMPPACVSARQGAGGTEV